MWEFESFVGQTFQHKLSHRYLRRCSFREIKLKVHKYNKYCLKLENMGSRYRSNVYRHPIINWRPLVTDLLPTMVEKQHPKDPQIKWLEEMKNLQNIKIVLDYNNNNNDDDTNNSIITHIETIFKDIETMNKQMDVLQNNVNTNNENQRLINLISGGQNNSNSGSMVINEDAGEIAYQINEDTEKKNNNNPDEDDDIYMNITTEDILQEPEKIDEMTQKEWDQLKPTQWKDINFKLWDSRLIRCQYFGTCNAGQQMVNPCAHVAAFFWLIAWIMNNEIDERIKIKPRDKKIIKKNDYSIIDATTAMLWINAKNLRYKKTGTDQYCICRKPCTGIYMFVL